MNFDLNHSLETNNEIWIVVDTVGHNASPATFELAAKAFELASQKSLKVAAVLLGSKLQATTQVLKNKGISKIYIADRPELENFHDEMFAEIISDFARAHKPETILGSATIKGRSLMPRVAALLKTGLTADCTKLEIKPETGKLHQTRPAFGGNILATIICETFPQMSTVRPHVFKQDHSARPAKSLEIIEYAKEMPSAVKKIIEQKNFEKTGGGLSDAKIVVSAGMGSGGPEGIKLIRKLADKLGAALGASRSVVDSGWLEYSHQVGQTGVTIHPEIYIACGISGAIQHLAGMQDSSLIIAINKDEDAPIFSMSDLTLHGDLSEILPELIQKIDV